MKKSRAPAKPIPERAEFVQRFFARDHAGALQVAERMLRTHPKHAQAWADAGVAAIYLKDNAKGYDYLLQAKRLGGTALEIPDGLAHAAFELGRIPQLKHYGGLALRTRDAQVPRIALQPPPRPAFDASRPTRNVVAFSLFGNNPRYCETALLNARAMPAIYPDWTCRIYVDESVPADVQGRLRDAGAQVIVVQGEVAVLPGTMWRFLAADDPDVDFVVFRDADSLISPRERRAVDQWLQSDRWFHIMRDNGTHTELILAGMWGLRRGLLPPLLPLMQDYLRVASHPTHIDQFFLRAHIWPYARHSAFTHDSFFDFMDPQPFPDGPPASTAQSVGNDHGAGFFTGNLDMPDGTLAHWALHAVDAPPGTPPVCAYPSVVRNGQFVANLPKELLEDVRVGKLVFKLHGSTPPPVAAG